MREMTVTQGLCELKLYDAKIEKAIDNANFVGAAKESSTKVGNVEKITFKANAEKAKQSILDLINNRARLKAAIVNSNAVTKVKIGSKEMTVAEAIERKSSIVYERGLLLRLKNNYAAANMTVTDNNNRVNAQVDKLLESAYGKDDAKRTNEIYDSIAKPYHAANDWELVDPIRAELWIEELDAQIDDFVSNVDVALSVSNATTIISF